LIDVASVYVEKMDGPNFTVLIVAVGVVVVIVIVIVVVSRR